MKTETWPIKKFIGYANNPRKNDHVVDDMAKFISEYGFKVPIIAKSSGLVVDGHLRLKAANKLNMKELPVILADDLTDAQIKAFRLAINKSAELATWDMDLLGVEINDLIKMGSDIELTGFSINDFDFLKKEKEKKQDKIPKKVKSVVKSGDLWQLGKHRLLCGDATKKEDIQILMSDKKADLVFTDPPHDLEFLDIIDEFSMFCDGAKFILHNDKFLSKLAAKYITRFEAFFVHDFIFHIGEGSRFYSQHDLIALFDYKKEQFNNLKDGFSTVIRKMSERQKGTKTLSHKHQKPVFLVELFIKHFTKENEIMLDVFLGSGTGIIACESTNRICYGLELEPGNCDIIIKRWEDFTKEKAVKK